jgi:uncharacterized protein YjbJ (UPF0337 family)
MEAMMDMNQASPEEKQMQARVKAKWVKLTGDVRKNLAAEKDSFVGRFQERYRALRKETEAQLDELMKSETLK